MKKYDITGMSCAACSSRVEKAVSKVDGVESCVVNLLTNSMTVEGTADETDIISAVEAAGYGVKHSSNNTTKSQVDSGKREFSTTKVRLFSSLVFLLVLMYVSMGHTMMGFPLPEVFSENPVNTGLVQMLLSAIVMVINQKFFVSGFKGIIKKSPNMDTLVALGSGAAFVYGVYVVFRMSSAVYDGNAQYAEHLIHELYFESAAMILTLITVGKMLEEYSKGKTTDALRGLVNLAPKNAVIIRDGKEVTVQAEQIAVGDVFVVRPGESIPADGIITEGSSAVDESALTGESIPIDKSTGDSVACATVNRLGFIKCRATAVSEDTLLSKIIKTVSDTAATKAPIAKAADKVSGIFVPTVILIAVAATVVWLLLGESLGFAVERGISVLVISCPCALGLATPVAIMVGSGIGARHGILFKTAATLEETGKAKIVALDKTGTITKGEPEVTDVIVFEGEEKELLKKAISLEMKSEHPLAKAVVKMAKAQGVETEEIINFEVFPGNGVSADTVHGKAAAGNLNFIEKYVTVSSKAKESAENLSEQGKTPMFFAEDGILLGIIAVADSIKTDSRPAIDELKRMGIRTVMITGDNQKTALAIAENAGIDEVVADVLPIGKDKEIRKLMEDGKVVMVGDGINDAPALVAANSGIAIGAGSDIAVDAADVVLVKNSLVDAVKAIKLSRVVIRNIYQNLFWAFFYNAIGIPLAAGMLIPLGLKLNPMFGAAAMSLSSFCVVSNALRLNMIKFDKKTKSIKERKKKMTKVMKIEGMMCPHCEANVKAALEGINGVELAEVSHQTGTAKLTLTENVSDELLQKTVEDKGYKVISVE